MRVGSAYRTVRACRSVGAPESTAAATLSPGSLPSMTLFGMGENVLRHIISVLAPSMLPNAAISRCPVVRHDIVIRVMAWLALRSTLLPHQRLCSFLSSTWPASRRIVRRSRPWGFR